MDVANPKYFDYLDEYGDALQSRLRIPNLVKRINVWRKNGADDPEGVGSGCRNVVEKMLNALIADPDVTNGMLIEEKIHYAESQKKVSDDFAKKFHTIRKIGNKSAHDSIDFLNAQISMVLLDVILRKYIYESGIGRTILYPVKIINDTVFTILTDDEATKLNKQAKTAAILSGDGSIEKEAQTVSEIVEAQNTKSIEATILMKNTIGQINAKVEQLGIDDAQVAADFDKLDKVYKAVTAESKIAADKIQFVIEKVESVLNEHDFIKKILKGKGEATSAQLKVLAFPKGSNAASNILQISGGAGTGKTLCLLAKLIRDISDDITANAQSNMFGNTYKKALFVCFNKQLAGYVQNLAKNYPEVTGSIEIVSFDQYINQLVKTSPSREYKHLEGFAKDVRYSDRFKITYKDSFAKKAMEIVCKQYPKDCNTYYLNHSDSDNVKWIDDEISWLESRYENVADAKDHYPTAARVGRGQSGRRPDERVREIILRIWGTYCKQLDDSNHYSMEQAIKRLMKSKFLPSYDVIAIDEVQDFTMSSIKLLLRFRKSDKSKMYISGDEGQKIYQRDFTWKELDSAVKGHTITLEKNMRNSYSIQAFANRLLGEKTPFEDASAAARISRGTDDAILKLLQGLQSKTPDETTVLIGNKSWYGKLNTANIPIKNPKTIDRWGESVDTKIGLITEPGVYIISELSNKGLEFDNVIIANAGEKGNDIELEKTLRYVHFTRARKRLYVFYYGEPSKLLKQYYSDFIQQS